MNRAVGYVRVSSEEQRMFGVSLDMQREKVRQYCTLNDLELIGIEADEGISAKDMSHRPGIQRVVSAVESKTADAVVCFKLDRIARNTIDALTFARLLDKRNVALHSITEKLDTKSALGSFFFSLTASLAEMERRLIGERTAAAIDHKRASGESYSGREALYGYRKENGLLMQVESEQAAISFVMHRAGTMSVSRICRELIAAGHRPRNGAMFWHPKVVRTIIERSPVRAEIDRALELSRVA